MNELTRKVGYMVKVIKLKDPQGSGERRMPTYLH